MSSPEISAHLDPDEIYENPQGQYFSEEDEVPGRIRRATDRIFRTKDELISEVHSNPTVSSLVEHLHDNNFYTTAEGVVGDIVLTVQKHKRPLLGAIAGGAILYEVVRHHKGKSESSE